MLNKLACLWVIVLSACTAGPSRPEPGDNDVPGVAIRAHFLDLPEGEVQLAQVQAYWARRYDESSVEDLTIQQTPAGGAVQRFVTPDVQMTLQVNSDLSSMTAGPDLPDLRFFALSASLTRPGRWRQPGRLLVYATQETTWSPFGAAGETVTFPRGYSWLNRTCAVPGQVEMEMRPIDETVEFRRVSAGYESADIAGWERAFVASCGVTGPAMDMGTRVFFDRAQEIAWAPDDSSLYFLSVAETAVDTQSVALREVRLADSFASELAVVPHGSSLQVDKTGAVHVHEDPSLLTLAPATHAILSKRLLPASVSPDGRWIAHHEYAQLLIWDTAAGADVTAIDGLFAGWSPNSQLAYWSSQNPPNVLSTISPGVPGGAPKSYPYWVDPRTIMALVWSSSGPLLAKPLRSADGGYEGLALVDPATGAERQVIDPSAGVIGASSASSLDVMVVWLTKCFGLFDTLCSSSLLKINLLDATVQTVAVSSDVGPVSISADSRRLAFGAPNGIYLKELP